MTDGLLYVVATPLGNLEDWSPRARRVVAEADLVLVEDTRVSRKLFAAFDLHPQAVRVFERHRERRETENVLQVLAEGRSVALLTDAGTPAIADPGATLVRAALDAGVDVRAVPGPSVLAAALSIAGIERLPVVFHGYPPPKAGEREALITGMVGDEAAHVLLLPPHDARALLEIIAGKLPRRRIALCRELTKLHEAVHGGKAADVLAAMHEAEAFRGEMTLVIDGAEAGASQIELHDLVEEARRLRDRHALAGRELSDFLAFRTGVPRKVAYRAVEQLKAETSPE